MNRKTVRSLYVLAAAAMAADLPVACGSDDGGSSNASQQVSTGGYATGNGAGVAGVAGVPMNNGAVSGIGNGGSGAMTPCVASLCPPVSNGTACCVGTYGPCGAMTGTQCVGTGPVGSQGGTTGAGGRSFGGRTGRGGRNGGGFGNFGGFGAGGLTANGGVTATGGAPGSGGADSDGAAPPADSGPGAD